MLGIPASVKGPVLAATGGRASAQLIAPCKPQWPPCWPHQMLSDFNNKPSDSTRFIRGIFEWSRLPAFLAFSFTACCWRQESIKEKCSRSVFSRIEPYSPALPRIKCKSGTISCVFAWSNSQTWLTTSCFNQQSVYSIIFHLLSFILLFVFMAVLLS